MGTMIVADVRLLLLYRYLIQENQSPLPSCHLERISTRRMRETYAQYMFLQLSRLLPRRAMARGSSYVLSARAKVVASLFSMSTVKGKNGTLIYPFFTSVLSE